MLSLQNIWTLGILGSQSLLLSYMVIRDEVGNLHYLTIRDNRFHWSRFQLNTKSFVDEAHNVYRHKHYPGGLDPYT